MPVSTTRVTCLLASLVLLATGCTKEKLESCPGHCTIITGRLVTAGGREGIAGAAVVAKWLVPTSFGARAAIKSQTTTDATGRYRLSFFIEDNELTTGYFSVFYPVDKNQYYTIGDPEHAFYQLKWDTIFTIPDFLIPRLATINLTVPNASQIQGYFSVELTTAYGHNITLSKNQQGSGTSISVPTQAGPFAYLVSTAGDQQVYLRTTKSNNGTYLRTLDSLTIPAGSTRPVTITY